MNNISAIILAAGKGTRMNSELPKVLHKVGDKPMVFYTIEKLQKLGVGQIVVVVSPERPQVKEAIEEEFNEKLIEIASSKTPRNDGSQPRGTRGTLDTRGTCTIDFAFQEETKGTAHAIATGLAKVNKETEFVICLNGDDSTFYKISTLKQLVASHKKAKKPISMVTLYLNDQTRALGRVVRDEFDEFVKVMEHKDYILTDLLITEISCGAYVFDKNWLAENYNNVQPNAITGEFYVNELFDMAIAQKKGVNIYVLEDSNEWVGINTPEELAKANELVQSLQV
jgi:bifunctional UDP-N-acetylglucosamine pyrophosphorylase / glucosamine-1-phosphate N-acetyltransferase